MLKKSDQKGSSKNAKMRIGLKGAAIREEDKAGKVDRVIIRKQNGPGSVHLQHWWMYFCVNGNWRMIDFLADNEIRIFHIANLEPKDPSIARIEQNYSTTSELTWAGVLQYVRIIISEGHEYNNSDKGERFSCQQFALLMANKMKLTKNGVEIKLPVAVAVAMPVLIQLPNDGDPPPPPPPPPGNQDTK